MRDEDLLPGLAPALNDEIQAEAAAESRIAPVALHPPALADKVVLASSADDAERALEPLYRANVAAIGIDTEFGYTAPPVPLRSGAEWYDPSTLVTKVVSLAAWLNADDGKGLLYSVVLDVRRPGVAAVIEALLRDVRVPLVAHNLKAEVHAMSALKIKVDWGLAYDTHLGGRALTLGREHRRARVAAATTTTTEAIEAEAVQRKRKEHQASLIGQCLLYGLTHPFAVTKKTYQQRFLALGPDEPLTLDLVKYAASDAELALQVYVKQQAEILRQGISHHFYTVEMPYCRANANIEAAGVHVSPSVLSEVRQACKAAVAHHQEALKAYDIDNPRSNTQVVAALKAMQLDHLLTVRTKTGRHSLAEDVLKDLVGYHPVFDHLWQHAKYARIAGEEWLTGLLTCADGRIRPSHQQLGTETGRNSCSMPNIAGIGKILRPAVTVPVGRALVELDFAQIEVGVIGAVHGDQALITAYNSGDLYMHIGREFHRDELTEAELAMSLRELRAARPELRKAMKVFVLSILYGVGPDGVAAQLGIPKWEAQDRMDRFLAMFPGVRSGLTVSAEAGRLRGYAYTWTGLRRHLPGGGTARWIRNLLRNTPIQGSAATVFKLAVIGLDKAFQGTSTMIVLPVHDAVVIECDLAALTAVCQEARYIMRSALRSVFPQLDGKVDVNASQPHCWNKDGHADSIKRFVEDPAFTL